MITIDKEITLVDKLNEIVDVPHIEEVKVLVSALSKISKLKYFLETKLSENTLYENFSDELNKEFNIVNLKIVHNLNEQEILLYQCGDLDFEYKYIFKNRVSTNIDINIYLGIDTVDEYTTLILNTYFKELVDLLYLQFILIDIKRTEMTDSLTQLQNRISFNSEMKTLVPLAIREQMKFGVLLINIDRFRAVNDEHGDEFGDKFLKLYADVIKANIRTSDIAVRFSGGEFLVLLINVENEDMTLKIAQKIQNKLSDSYLLSPNFDKFRKTVCIGISMFPEDSNDINQVIKYSEMALSDARDKGRNNIIRYEIPNLSKIEFF